MVFTGYKVNVVKVSQWQLFLGANRLVQELCPKLRSATQAKTTTKLTLNEPPTKKESNDFMPTTSICM